MTATADHLILLPTRDVAHLLHVPVGTVHRWAHEDGWTRHGTRAARRWDYAEAQASHDRRREVDRTAPQANPGTLGLTAG